MKKVLYLSSIPLLILLLTSFSYSEKSKISGEWKSIDEDETKYIKIYLAKNGYYYGKVNNPKSEHYGEIILRKLEFDADTKKYTGTMSPPDKNMTLDVTINMVNDNKFKMVGKKLFMTKTIYFSKIK